MSTSAIIEMDTVPQKVKADPALYSQLALLDWVVLDFTDGVRSFKEFARIIPTEQSALMASFRHLRTLGMLTWKEIELSASSSHPAMARRRGTLPFSAPPVGGSIASRLETNAIDIAIADLSDDQCLQYLPQKLLIPFRGFTPTHTDASLDIDLGTQALIEFLVLNLNTLSPYEILGVDPLANAAAIRQAYLKRSRLFHPDRYFRKNIGNYSNHLATLFKAVTRAFGSLQ